MKVKIIEQRHGEEIESFEENVNYFLSQDIIVVHIRINPRKDFYLTAIIIYKKGNS